MSSRELPTYSDAPEPLTDRERALVNRIFSDYFEVPGEWKTALKMDLERDPPILGQQTLGPTGGGGTGGPPTGAASGDLTGSYPSPQIASGVITDSDVNTLNKDGLPGIPSLRTLGTGAQQAVAGDDSRLTGASGDKNYVHNQVGLLATWTVTHNLGKYPSVFVVDTGNNVIIPDVHYVDVNSLTLTFATATAGKAYVN